VAVRWMIDNLGVEVIALAVNVGQDGGTIDAVTITERAVAAGAVAAVTAVAVGSGRLVRPGAAGLAVLVGDPLPLLQELADRGVRCASFSGSG